MIYYMENLKRRHNITGVHDQEFAFEDKYCSENPIGWSDSHSSAQKWNRLRVAFQADTQAEDRPSRPELRGQTGMYSDFVWVIG
jgi:hypothetical protein